MALKPVPKKRGRPKGYPKSGGRKKGTPNKITSEVKELAQRFGESVIDELYRIAMNKRSSDTDKIAAIRELLMRGYGRPASPIHLGGFDGGPLEITMLLKAASPEQVRAFIESLTLEHKVLLSQKLIEGMSEMRPLQ